MEAGRLIVQLAREDAEKEREGRLYSDEEGHGARGPSAMEDSEWGAGGMLCLCREVCCLSIP